MANSYFLDVMRFDFIFSNDVGNWIVLTLAIIMFLFLLSLTVKEKNNYKKMP